MMIREPAVAGRFYPGDPDECRAMLRACVDAAQSAHDSSPADPSAIRDPQFAIRGGVVPHAGWVCSGAIAARTFLEISKGPPPATVIIFGAIHVPHGKGASVFPSGAWQTPLGMAHIDDRLAERLCGQTGLLESDPHSHEEEHSIEVEIPFIQYLLPAARIVPIMVPANEHASALGAAVGSACQSYQADVAFLASSDLTHYGPAYAFTPRSVGPDGLVWARDVNDRRMISLMSAMKSDRVVPEAIANQNACGPGAIAAAIAACTAMGATRGDMLEHTTSHEVLSRLRSEPPRDSVGYVSMIYV
jgi:AmmeMemoRadiSam system protein B